MARALKMGKMSNRKKHSTTKNTKAVPPVSRMCVIEGECNGLFKIVTDFTSEKETKLFDSLYLEWFDSPLTIHWHITSFIVWFKERYPNRVCLLWDDYDKITRGKVIHATKEEWESENNENLNDHDSDK